MNSYYPLIPNNVTGPDLFTDASIHLLGIKEDICVTMASPNAITLEDSAGNVITGTREGDSYLLADKLGRRLGIVIGTSPATINVPYGVASFVAKALIPYGTNMTDGLLVDGTLLDGNVPIEGVNGVLVTNDHDELRIDIVGTPDASCVIPRTLKELRIHVLEGPRPIMASKTAENRIHLLTDFDEVDACNQDNIPGTLPNPDGVVPDKIGDEPCAAPPAECARIYPETDHLITPVDGNFILTGTGSALTLSPVFFVSDKSDIIAVRENVDKVIPGGLLISLEAGQ